MDILETLHHSAHLVKAWGQCRLHDGRTLAEALTLEGVPFWDAFAVDFARMHLPSALSSEAPSSGLVQRLRPYLSRAKHKALALGRARRSTAGCVGWTPGRTVLCLGFNAYIYRDVLQPVAKRLQAHAHAHTVSLSEQAWARTAAYDNPAAFQTIWSHWDREVGRQASSMQRALGRVEGELRAPNALPKILRDGERNMWELVSRIFDWFFRVYVPLLIPQAVVARHILEKHRPAVVISPDVADPRTRVYTLLCQRMSIPSLVVQFGLTGTDGIEWQFLAADAVAVWGESSRQALLAHGVPAERISITGSPRHDGLTTMPEAAVRARRDQLGVPEGRTMVVLASAYQLESYNVYSDPERLRSMKRAVFEAADQTPGIRLVVKPHPLEDVSETQVLAGNSRNVMFVDKKSDIRELTRVCDAFVSFGSTATADALIARKITICPAFPGYIWSDLFVNSGATLVPRSREETLQTFQSIAAGSGDSILARLEPARQRLLQEWVSQADGKASPRIEALALQMARL